MPIYKLLNDSQNLILHLSIQIAHDIMDLIYEDVTNTYTGLSERREGFGLSMAHSTLERANRVIEVLKQILPPEDVHAIQDEVNTLLSEINASKDSK